MPPLPLGFGLFFASDLLRIERRVHGHAFTAAAAPIVQGAALALVMNASVAVGADARVRHTVYLQSVLKCS
jgi:hypothetical protein